MVRIQGKSSNHGDNRNVGAKKYPTGQLRVQDSSANYMGRKVSTSKTPSPPEKPYPAQTRAGPKPRGTTMLPGRTK